MPWTAVALRYSGCPFGLMRGQILRYSFTFLCCYSFTQWVLLKPEGLLGWIAFLSCGQFDSKKVRCSNIALSSCVKVFWQTGMYFWKIKHIERHPLQCTTSKFARFIMSVCLRDYLSLVGQMYQKEDIILDDILGQSKNIEY